MGDKNLRNKSYREIFRGFIRSWNSEFPLLKLCKPTLLAFKAGPLIIGLQFMNSQWNIDDDRSYSIYIEIFPLWRENQSELFYPAYSDCVREIHRRRKSAIWIDYHKHNQLFYPAVKSVEHEVGFILKDFISLESLWNFLNYTDYIYLRYPTRYRIRKTQAWIGTIELKMGLAAYFDRPELQDDARRYLEFILPSWNEYKNEKGLPKWIKWTENSFSDREKFMAVISQNLELPKVKRLNSGIIYDNGFEPVDNFKEFEKNDLLRRWLNRILNLIK